MRGLFWLFFVLSVLGAINWGMIGLFEINLVEAIFGPMSAASRVVYFLVGLGGLLLAIITPGSINYANLGRSSARAS